MDFDSSLSLISAVALTLISFLSNSTLRAHKFVHMYMHTQNIFIHSHGLQHLDSKYVGTDLDYINTQRCEIASQQLYLYKLMQTHTSA